MHSNVRLVISFAIACVGGLATALLVLPAAAGTNSWTAIGPDGVNNSYGAAFAVDPSSPSTIYSVVNGTTIMKTADGGGDWAFLADNPKHFKLLVVDPVSPATIYAIGQSGPCCDSIYKSIDGGVNWAVSNGLPTTSSIQSLAIAPSLNSTLYAGSSGMGILKSIDGGLSWATVNDGQTGLYAYALAIDPTNADVAYVAEDDATVFKLTAGTDQWRQVPIPLPAGAFVQSLAIDPVTPSTVYAAFAVVAPNDVLVQAGIFKSIDGGETWFAAQNPPSDTNGLRAVRALVIDPSAPWRIYADTSYGVFMSTDAAASWTPINAGLPSLYTWGLSIDRTGSILRTASYTGLFEYQIAGPESSGTVAVIEYFDAAFGDYFITASPNEISQLDNGAFPGWARTGLQFNAYATPESPSVSVCRFFSTGFAPKSTHFFTPIASECTALRLDSNWTLESPSAFAIALPGAEGACAAGLIPVYRFYDGSRGGVPNHRYTTDMTARAQMIAQGWVAEGVGPNAVEMCSPQ